MNRQVKAELDAICRKVEQAFPEVVCAYEGFAKALAPTEEGDIVLEAFFAPKGAGRSIAQITYQDVRRIRRQYGLSVAIVPHYPSDTIQYYIDDVMAVLSSRRVDVVAPGARRVAGTVLDPGAYCSHTLPLYTMSQEQTIRTTGESFTTGRAVVAEASNAWAA